jgi:hypothetical protein
VTAPQSPTPDVSGTPGRKLPAMPRISIRPPMDVIKIVLVWAAWLAIICAFQIGVQARVQPARPDNTLAWTANETGDGFPAATGPGCRPYLADPNMNEHVAFDSEYYISIAIGGYDNPQSVGYVSQDGRVVNAGVPTCNDGLDGWTPLNYAFMPVYPMAMRPVMAVEQHLPFTSDMTPAGQATLAGIIVASLGGLLAMLALARMMAFLGRRRKRAISIREAAALLKGSPMIGILWGASFALEALVAIGGFVTGHTEGLLIGGIAALVGATFFTGYLERNQAPADDATSSGSWGGTHGLRTALYLLVFPTGFYLAQVYTEGLFIGLAFMACALAVEKKVVWAAIFACLAALTRQAGLFLFLPVAWASFQILRDSQIRPKNWRVVLPIVAPFAPLATFAAWFFSPLGRNWDTVEHQYFTRSFDIPKSLELWHRSWDSLITGVDKSAPDSYAIYGGGPLQPSSSFYIAVEFMALILGVVACIWLLRRMPGVALFGLGLLAISAGSAGAQGMDRYVLAVPAIFLMLAWFGRREVFDRAWVLASTLLMGLLVMLFTFGFWVS